MNLETARCALGAYIAADVPAMLWGAPGVGKSDLVASVCADAGRTLVDERLSTLESLDLRGTPHVVGGNVAWARPTMFARLWAAHEAGNATALFLDEINAAPLSVQAAAFQLVLNRSVGDQHLPPGCVVIAAGNRQSDKAAAQRMPSALANRFGHIDVEPDADTWRAWASAAGLSPVVIAFLAFRPALIHDMSGPDARAFPSPRSWAQVAKVAGAPDSVRPALVRGLVGEAAAGEFEAFMRIFGRVPSIDSILSDPTGRTCPDGCMPGDAALLFALATGLAQKSTVANMAAVWTYARRMPAEFTVLTMTDATRRDPALKSTRAFVEYAAAFHGVLS